MDKDKVGNFIKNLRKKYNLTQSDIADKYNVTYQSVSKWENGINLPSLSLLKQMSKDYNIDITDILDGEFSSKKHNKNNLIFIIIILFLTLISFFIILKITKKDNFVFKTISTDCKDFNVSGSIAYDKDKSFIHISNVKYCGIKKLNPDISVVKNTPLNDSPILFPFCQYLYYIFFMFYLFLFSLFARTTLLRLLPAKLYPSTVNKLQNH